MSTVFLTLSLHRRYASELASVADPRKVVVITGGNRGIGLAAAKQLAATGQWSVILACRSPQQGQLAKNSITVGAENVSVVELDIANLQSVEKFAKEIGEMRIDCLALNAGIHSGNSAEPARSSQGYELTIATNHICHFYLTQLLHKNLNKSKAGRIVYVASSLHDNKSNGSMLGEMSGLEAGFRAPHSMISGRTFSADQAYRDSKLCNVMMTRELARRLKADKSAITCNALAPGLIPTTGLFRAYNPYLVSLFGYFMRDVLRIAVDEEEGGKRLAHTIASEDLNGVSGEYVAKNRQTGRLEPVEPSEEAKDAVKAGRLWSLTEQLIAASRDS